MKIQIKLDRQAIRQIENAVRESAVETMEEMQNDLNDSETMPFDSGEMQNNQTFVRDESDEKRICVRLDNSADQSRYLYYGLKMVDSETGKGPALIHDKHGSEVGFRFRKGAKLKVKQPEEKLKFQQGHNDNAGAKWLEPYINGKKKDFVKEKYIEVLRGRLKK